MSLDRRLRLSGYLTLALSCTALVYAEIPFLPDLQFCLAPLLTLLLLAWWVEGRWLLPNWGANLLGLLIAVGGSSWLVTQLTNDESLLSRVPLHLALLPYMGPLVMASLLVKVFRPREAGDFWRLQGLGLMQIGLGCVLDGGPEFGILMAAYLAGALACLGLRYRVSTFGERAALSSLGLLFFTVRWMLWIAVPAIVLFLVTPRRDSAAWEPLNNLRTGTNRTLVQGGGDEINLNGTGRIELDDEIALHLVAVDADGQPYSHLPVEQRWRGVVLDWYENGKWTQMHSLPDILRRSQRELPDFGPGQLFLTFTVPPRQPGSLVLAEPIQFGAPPSRLPVVTLTGEGRPRLFGELLGSVQPLKIKGRQEFQYRQVVPASNDPSRTFADGVHPGAYLENLVVLPPHLVPVLKMWTLELLRRLSQQSRYHLPASVRAALTKPPDSFLLEPDEFESVAVVLNDYLALAGEYTYTLELARRDISLDPVLDFLFNVKQGHCERYATALALMLRSLGIPARIVKGFHGLEAQGEGQYVVRHRQAHAWVEILVPHIPSRLPEFDWVGLDPTPMDSATSTPRFSLTRFWEGIERFCLESWRTRIVDYNADEQTDLWDSLMFDRRIAALVKLALVAMATLAVLGVWFVLRRPSRRRTARSRTADAVAFYLRFVRILERYAALRPRYGQTPREYGAMVQTFLQTRPELHALAELPLRVVELFYRVRFGGQTLREEERRALDVQLDRFAEALRC